MAILSPQLTQTLVQHVANSPRAGNFNDYVKYARGALNAGQTPNAAGFQQFQGQQGQQTQSPGGGKNQMQPQSPGGGKYQMPPQAPVSEMGRLGRVPTGLAQQTPTSVPSPKSPRNLQYAAALSRAK